MTTPHHSQLCVVLPKVSRGIWFNESPFLQPRLIFLYQLFLIITLSHLLYFLLKPFNQPKFVCLALAGIILGPPLTGKSDGVFLKKATFPVHETLLVGVWAYIGVLNLIFLAAVKMDMSILRKNAKNASFIGFTSVFCSHVVMSALTNAGISDDDKSTFPMLETFTFSMSSIRLSNMMYTFHELNIITSDIGQLATSAALCTEALSWTWLVILLATNTQDVPPWIIVGSSISLVAVTVCVIRPFMMWICRKTPEGQPVREFYMVVCILLVLCWAVISDFIGSFYIGIFAIGLVVPSGPPLGSTFCNKIELFVMEIIMPMFYLLVGSLVNIRCISLKVFIEIIFLVIMGVAAKFFGAFVTGLACKVKPKHAVLLGLMLNIRGPLDLFISLRLTMEDDKVKRRKVSRRLTTEYYSILILTELIVTVILSPMIVPLYRSCFRIRPTESATRYMRSIQTTPDNTELRLLCSVFNQGSVPCIASLIEALDPTAFNPLSVHIVHITELTGRAAPQMDSFGNHLEKVKCKRLHQIIVAFGNYLKAYFDVLQVRAHSVVAPYNSMHEYICRLALEEELCVILIPFHKSASAFNEFDREAAAGLHTFNINMQTHAACSVGILLDRAVFRSMAGSHCPTGYAAAVVFIGGPHDREAISLGTRISGNPMARVTLLRIVFKDLYRDNHDKTESKLDFRMVDEFKLRNGNNGNVEYFESEAKDADDVLCGIRTFIGDKHDLIIVGQAHENVTKAMSDDAILGLSENPELGMIADFIASSEFYNSTSILVMQHYGGSNDY